MLLNLNEWKIVLQKFMNTKLLTHTTHGNESNNVIFKWGNLDDGKCILCKLSGYWTQMKSIECWIEDLEGTGKKTINGSIT